MAAGVRSPAWFPRNPPDRAIPVDTPRVSNPAAVIMSKEAGRREEITAGGRASGSAASYFGKTRGTAGGTSGSGDVGSNNRTSNTPLAISRLVSSQHPTHSENALS